MVGNFSERLKVFSVKVGDAQMTTQQIAETQMIVKTGLNERDERDINKH